MQVHKYNVWEQDSMWSSYVQAYPDGYYKLTEARLYVPDKLLVGYTVGHQGGN